MNFSPFKPLKWVFLLFKKRKKKFFKKYFNNASFLLSSKDGKNVLSHLTRPFSLFLLSFVSLECWNNDKIFPVHPAPYLSHFCLYRIFFLLWRGDRDRGKVPHFPYSNFPHPAAISRVISSIMGLTIFVDFLQQKLCFIGKFFKLRQFIISEKNYNLLLYCFQSCTK